MVLPLILSIGYLRPDKSIRWVNTKGYADRNDEGQVVRLFGTTQDITELVQIQEELKENQAQLKETHRLAHIGTWDWTAETDTVIWSEELYHIAGCDPLAAGALLCGASQNIHSR